MICPEPKEPAWRHESKTFTYRYSQVNKHQTTPNPDKIYSRLYLEKYLSETLKHFGFDPVELSRVLNPEERAFLTGLDPLVGDLIDSPMVMDRMDYLMRDAHMTGLSMGFTNADALIQCVSVPIENSPVSAD